MRGKKKVHPPTWAIKAVMARGNWPGVRYLEAVIESPILRLDGTILDTPGYDAHTALLYEPRIDFPRIPEQISQAEAAAAAAILLGLVVDFPFLGRKGEPHPGATHAAVWLAGLLTPVARFAIQGPTPIWLFDGNSVGTGKTMLCDLISIIITGREMARTTFSDHDEEMRKRITSIALEGDPLVLLDNVATPFGGQNLEAVTTGTTWRDRILGKSKMTTDLPMNAVWYATGNNVTLKKDILRRLLYCRLETREERPEERADFREANLLDHVRRNRGALLVAALTVLRGYFLAGRPDPKLTPFGSFEAWTGVVRGEIHWAIGLDACATRDTLTEHDDDTIGRRGLVEGWAELPGANEGLTVAEALKVVENFQHDYSTLRAVLMEWSDNNLLPSPQVVGNRLKAIRGRVCNGMSLDSHPYQGTMKWKVVERLPDFSVTTN